MPRILYVEDRAELRESLCLLLSKEGNEAIGAGSYDEGLAAAKTQQFDLYIIDSWIAGVSGVNLCKALRKFNSNTPILFYYSLKDEYVRGELLDCNVQGLLPKSTNVKPLLAAISRIFSESA